VSEGVIVRTSPLSLQLCVPKDWTDDQVRDFAERVHPCGTELGWQIRREGDAMLRGAKERVVCASDPERVHIMLDA